MDESGSISFGGNTFSLWRGKIFKNIGSYFTEKSEKLIKKGSKITVTNPISRLVNPFTLIIGFTVGKDKYQIITQGNFKEIYKSKGVEENPITEQECFILIVANKKEWFLKS